VAETKKILYEGRRQRIENGAAEMVATSARLFASPDAQEGIHAFLERRRRGGRRPRASRRSQAPERPLGLKRLPGLRGLSGLKRA
jgi:hypothetical protein